MEVHGERCSIKYHDGDIKDQSVDAIINFVYPEEHQRDAYGILAAAGEAVAVEFENGKAQDNRLVRRGVVATSGGDLPFKKIYHIIATHQPSKLKDSLYVALRQADRDEMKSIAVPKLLCDDDDDDHNDSEKETYEYQQQEMMKILGLNRSEMTLNYFQTIHGFGAEEPVCIDTIHVLIPASLSEIMKRLSDSNLHGFGSVFKTGDVCEVTSMSAYARCMPSRTTQWQ